MVIFIYEGRTTTTLDDTLLSTFQDTNIENDPLDTMRPTIDCKGYAMRRSLPAMPKTRTEGYRRHFIRTGTRIFHKPLT